MPGLFVRALGPLYVGRGDGEHEISSRRQRSLLAALATAPDASLSVGGLVEAVWEDEPPSAARTTLQTYVSRLRRQLGAEVIEFHQNSYRLARTVEVDVATARGLLAEVNGANQSWGERAELAASGLALWTGPVLSEFEDHEWFRPIIVTLEEMRRDLRDVAAEALLESGQHAAALALTTPATVQDPLREPTHVLHVRALHAGGRTLEAVRAAAAYRNSLRSETGLDPGSAFVETERLALSGEAPPAPATPRIEEGTQDRWSSATLSRPTPLLGRDADLERLVMLVGDANLVSVVGVGGVGKTRLAAELVHVTNDERRCIVVDLAPATPDTVDATLTTAFGLRAENAGVRALAELLETETVRLVLDNAEHVAREVGAIVRPILDRCPGVSIVVTSRTPLGLPDEHVVEVQPLRVDGVSAPAPMLLVDRARRSHARVDLDPDDPSVRALCAQLDGLPLALELAAGRAATLGAQAVADRLATSLDLLRTDAGHGRHQSMDSVLSWSIDSLGEPAQWLLGALSTFSGSFDLHAAEVVGGEVVDEPVSMLLGRLIATSLVSSTEPGRYRLLELVRRHAQDVLVDPLQSDRLRTAHARWVLDELVRIEHDSRGPDEAATTARLDQRRHDVSAAMESTVERRDVRGAAELAFVLCGPLLYRPDAELLSRITRMVDDLDAVETSSLPAELWASNARAAFLLGDLDAAETGARRALDSQSTEPRSRERGHHAMGVTRLYQGRFVDAIRHFEAGIGDDSSVAGRLDALGGLALAQCYTGDLDAAVDTLHQHRAISEAIDSDTYRAFADYVAAEIHVANGEIDRATEALHAATRRAWSTGATFVWGIASTVLAGLLVRHRPEQEARDHLPVLVARWRRTATWPQLWTTLRLIAELLARAGQSEVALLVLAASDHDPAAPTLVGADLDQRRRLMQAIEEQLGPAACRAISETAATLDRVTVLERALDALAARPGA